MANPIPKDPVLSIIEKIESSLSDAELRLPDRTVAINSESSQIFQVSDEIDSFHLEKEARSNKTGDTDEFVKTFYRYGEGTAAQKMYRGAQCYEDYQSCLSAKEASTEKFESAVDAMKKQVAACSEDKNPSKCVERVSENLLGLTEYMQDTESRDCDEERESCWDGGKELSAELLKTHLCEEEHAACLSAHEVLGTQEPSVSHVFEQVCQKKKENCEDLNGLITDARETILNGEEKKVEKRAVTSASHEHQKVDQEFAYLLHAPREKLIKYLQGIKQSHVRERAAEVISAFRKDGLTITSAVQLYPEDESDSSIPDQIDTIVSDRYQYLKSDYKFQKMVAYLVMKALDRGDRDNLLGSHFGGAIKIKHFQKAIPGLAKTQVIVEVNPEALPEEMKSVLGI